MTTIHLLSESVINQIAAGEIIENPSSVIKELLDNAIDAKSTRIKIELKQGGLQFIKITDDGIGMGKEDAQLSLKRHATSKLQKPEDLFSIHTLGFRGEALASIASVSKMTLTTSNGGEASKLMSYGGEEASYEVTARVKGTTIEIRDLFFNTPARRKFQKSASRNTADIVRLVQNFSLCYPHIRFDLISDGRSLLEFYPVISKRRGDLKKRLIDFFGSYFVENSKWVEEANEGYELWGMLGMPSIARKNRLGQYLFLNQRLITSNFVSECIKQAYATRLQENEFPVFVLFFNLPKETIDINVHPQKKQVRFLEQNKLKHFLETVVTNQFQRPSFVSESPAFFEPSSLGEKKVDFTVDFKEQDFDFEKPSPTKLKQKELPLKKVEIHILKIMGSYALVDPFSCPLEDGLDGVLLFDLKAVLSRLFFDFFSRKSKAHFEAQNLFFPISIDLTLQESLYLQNNFQDYKDLNLDIFPDKVTIGAIPKFFSEKEFRQIFISHIDRLIQEKPSNILKESYEVQFAKFSNRMAQKKTVFSVESIKAMIENLFICDSYAICPLGKANFIHLKINDVEKMFVKKRY